MKKTIFKLSEGVIKIYTVLCILAVVSAVLSFGNRPYFDMFFEIMLKIFSPEILGGKRGGIAEFVSTVVMFYKIYTVKNWGDTKTYNKALMLAVLGLVESIIIFFGLPDMRYF